jgi:coenzyme F420 hydrogenase subunit beta
VPPVSKEGEPGFSDIDPTVCTRCGACVSVCPVGVIAATGRGVHLLGECINCGLCYRVCPGMQMDFGALSEEHLGALPHDPLLGHYRRLAVAQATDEQTRQRAASGGVATALLKHLLASNRIVGALGVTMDRDKPWECQPTLLRSPEEAEQAAQSKYSLVSLDAHLAEALREPGQFALVGLPCHVHGLRRLQEDAPYRQKFPVVIGLFCGFNVNPAATEHLIEKLGFSTTHVARLEYRGGAWPGGLVIRTHDGRETSLAKDDYSYVNLMYAPRRCLACPDLTNELADLSVGDTWLKQYAGGWSTVICRSPQGEQLLQEAVQAGVLRMHEITREELLRSHGHLVAYKKEGYFVRQTWLRVPLDYRLDEPDISRRRWVQQTLLLALIQMLSNPLVRRLVQRLPLSWLGRISRWGKTASSGRARE